MCCTVLIRNALGKVGRGASNDWSNYIFRRSGANMDTFKVAGFHQILDILNINVFWLHVENVQNLGKRGHFKNVNVGPRTSENKVWPIVDAPWPRLSSEFWISVLRRIQNIVEIGLSISARLAEIPDSEAIRQLQKRVQKKWAKNFFLKKSWNVPIQLKNIIFQSISQTCFELFKSVNIDPKVLDFNVWPTVGWTVRFHFPKSFRLVLFQTFPAFFSNS